MYQPLQTPNAPVSTRRAEGKALRKQVPRTSHATLPPTEGRDPVGVLEASNEGRVEDLIPIRMGRMATSPFAYYRGAAAMMAADLAHTPTSGLTSQICGDAHLANFGLFASPERRLVFGVNDFDETLPGPWEWDVKRLTASIVIAGRENGFSDAEARSAAVATSRSYRQHMADFALSRVLDTWYATVDLDAIAAYLDATTFEATKKTTNKARRHDHLRALSKLTEVVDGQHRIRHDPPLLVPADPADHGIDTAGLIEVYDGYRASLPADRRTLLDRYRLVEMAHKVVGVGSVGTRCWVGLFQGDGLEQGSDPLFLQMKEAGPSVLERHLGAAEEGLHGQRVVHGQHLMQAVSDIFLGYTVRPDTGRHFYVRQLHDMKGSFAIPLMGPPELTYYGGLCGWTLARAHARSGDAAKISGYLGNGDTFDHAVADFAEGYADLNAADHAALLAAIESGRLPATHGI